MCCCVLKCLFFHLFNNIIIPYRRRVLLHIIYESTFHSTIHITLWAIENWNAFCEIWNCFDAIKEGKYKMTCASCRCSIQCTKVVQECRLRRCQEDWGTDCLLLLLLNVDRTLFSSCRPDVTQTKLALKWDGGILDASLVGDKLTISATSQT